MAKAKNRKPKPKPSKQRANNGKKHDKQDDISQYRAQLDALGLKIVHVNGDGNCFFRSLADQLDGNDEEHEKYRNMVVQYILNDRERFEPFIEDGQPFDTYCESMKKDGAWAGNMELQAASLVTHCNICIHRLKQPRWYIHNFDDNEVRTIHLSYHDGEHYNSLRLKEDPSTGPAWPIIIKADADPAETSSKAKVTSTRSKVEEKSIQLVMSVSGCQDAKKVEEVLNRLHGDEDAAVEELIADIGHDKDLTENDKPSSLPPNCNGAIENGSQENHNKELKAHSPGPEEKTQVEGSSKPAEKGISRNKACPCGSKKKYKACCGTVTAKNLAILKAYQAEPSGKTKRDKRQARKGGNVTNTDSQGSERRSPDVGALRI